MIEFHFHVDSAIRLLDSTSECH